MRQELQIRSRKIGPDHPLFITSEVGVTCNYDLGLAKELIDVTADAGADAAKFIFWFPDEIMSDRGITYDYQTTSGPKSENMYEMLSKLRFSLDQWHELKEHADKAGVILFSTVNSPSGIEWAEEIGLEAYKLSSWDFNHHPLWRRIAARGKPMIIDTGPVYTLDVAKVMALMQEESNDQSLLVHCIHTKDPDEINMRAIPYMRKAFDSLVGYSSSDRESETDIMAVTLGSSYIEKRLTMDRNLPGHHHVLSMEPGEFKQYVTMIRDVQRSLGREMLLPSRNDLAERRKWFRHLVAARDIPAGTKLTEEMLEGKRPETGGLSPEFMHLFIGRTTERDLKENEAISFEDICGE
jgi:sialic acid synthase SpsE